MFSCFIFTGCVLLYTKNNNMKEVTEEQIREKYKNAFECVDTYGDKFVINLDTLHRICSDYYCKSEKGKNMVVYRESVNKFAEILTYKNQVTEDDLIGDIKGFPIEVVQKMWEEPKTRYKHNGNDINQSPLQRRRYN